MPFVVQSFHQAGSLTSIHVYLLIRPLLSEPLLRNNCPCGTLSIYRFLRVCADRQIRIYSHIQMYAIFCVIEWLAKSFGWIICGVFGIDACHQCSNNSVERTNVCMANVVRLMHWYCLWAKACLNWEPILIMCTLVVFDLGPFSYSFISIPIL